MTFVFSIWYFVIIALVAGAIACLVVFLKMDKKDKILIEQFVKESSEPKETAIETEKEVKPEVSSQQ